MKNFFRIPLKCVPAITVLCEHKIDGEYVIINRSDDFCDIVQYSSRWHNLRVICVRAENLKKENELVVIR